MMMMMVMGRGGRGRRRGEERRNAGRRLFKTKTQHHRMVGEKAHWASPGPWGLKHLQAFGASWG
eukprot:8742290-Pyramimonas_sp.AAC.1